jgi:alpha-tubulin suppressor-like RCC1 family protein
MRIDSFHAFVADKGDVFGWGNSEYLQFDSVTSHEQLNIPRRLPLDPAIGKVIRVTAGSSACAILNERHEVHVWGYGYLGKGPQVDHLRAPSLIPPPLFHCDEFNPDLKVIDVTAGMRHFAAISNQGDLFMWGKNRNGCLGLGGTGAQNELLDQYFPLKVEIPASVVKISLGVDHSVALGKTC